MKYAEKLSFATSLAEIIIFSPNVVAQIEQFHKDIGDGGEGLASHLK